MKLRSALLLFLVVVMCIRVCGSASTEEGQQQGQQTTIRADAVAVDEGGAVCVTWSNMLRPVLHTGYTVSLNGHAVYRTPLLNGSVVITGKTCEEEADPSLLECVMSCGEDETCGGDDGDEGGGKRNKMMVMREWTVLLLPMVKHLGDGSHEKRVQVRSNLAVVEKVQPVESCDGNSLACVLHPNTPYCQPQAPPKRVGVVRFDVCGGQTNKMYSLVSGAMLALRLNANVNLPSTVVMRDAYDAATARMLLATSLYSVFDLTSVQTAFNDLGLKDVVDTREPAIKITESMLQKGTKEWRALALGVTSQGGVIEISCGYRAMCPYDDSVEGVLCCTKPHANVSAEALVSMENDIKLMRRFLMRLQPAQPIRNLADRVLEVMSKRSPYASLHLRLEGDWHMSRRDKTRVCFMDVSEVAEAIKAMPFARELETMPLYIMGGFRQTDPEIEYLSTVFEVITKDMAFENPDEISLGFDQQGYLDYLVGRNALYAIGNQCSSFSAMLRLYRLESGFDDSTYAYYNGVNSTECEYTWFGLPQPEQLHVESVEKEEVVEEDVERREREL